MANRGFMHASPPPQNMRGAASPGLGSPSADATGQGPLVEMERGVDLGGFWLAPGDESSNRGEGQQSAPPPLRDGYPQTGVQGAPRGVATRTTITSDHGVGRHIAISNIAHSDDIGKLVDKQVHSKQASIKYDRTTNNIHRLTTITLCDNRNYNTAECPGR